MTEETQRIAWACLPKEFKEEVKYEYRRVATKATKDEYDLGFMHAHEGMYGIHNLTSDAEEEVMLTAPRKDIVELYQEVQKTISQCKGTELAIQAIGIKNVIWSFFGSKCRKDEEQPKQKDCDNPLADKEGCRWRNDGKCAFDSACYFEPLNPQETTDHIPDVTKMVDNIIKEGFLKERRCNIAVQMVKAITQSPEIVDRISSAATDSLLDDILSDALYLTDKLIEKCEKGGSK